MLLQKYRYRLCKKESLRSQHDSTSFLFLPLFWCFQFRCSNGSSQHLYPTLVSYFSTYLALYLVQSDTKAHTHQVIFATVCRTFIVPLPASSLSVSSYDTDAFYHCQKKQKSYFAVFYKIWWFLILTIRIMQAYIIETHLNSNIDEIHN